MIHFPRTMMTQHPDNSAPYVTVQNEPDEAVEALRPIEQGGLGIEEVMVDFEGKLTPYHQTWQIASGLLHQGLTPGRDVFITPRIPNAAKESVFRQLMGILSIVETNVNSIQHSGEQAVRELIIPMVQSVEELINTNERVADVITLGNKTQKMSMDIHGISLIPLVEDVKELLTIDHLFAPYLTALKKSRPVSVLRFMLGRSDAALSTGLVPGTLACLIAIRKAYRVGQENGVEVAPILGCGALPFRGHFSPETLPEVLKTYRGVRTFTIQSALRYDHGPEKTRQVVETLARSPVSAPVPYSPEEEAFLINCIGIFAKHYVNTLVTLAEPVARISDLIPKTRDRLVRKSRVGYAREAADVKGLAARIPDAAIAAELAAVQAEITIPLPRAITFTAALYTLGIPPEIIGTGRGLAELAQRFGREGVDRLLTLYPQLKLDLTFAARHASPKIARNIIPEETLQILKTDLSLIDRVLELGLDFETLEDSFYHTLLKTIRPLLKHLTGAGQEVMDNIGEEHKILNEWIARLGHLRGSLG